MLSFLKTALTIGSSAFSLGKVLAIAVPVLAASHAIFYFGGTLVGAANERTKIAQAGKTATENHGTWLIEMADANNKAVLEEAKRLQDNQTIEGKLGDASAQPHSDGECVSAEFLRTLSLYR